MKKNIALAFAAIFVLGMALPSYAYVLLSPRRVWKSGPTVSVNTTGNASVADGNGGVQKVAQAIGTWGVVTGATTNGKAVRGDGKPYIELHSNGHLCNGSCLAATLTGYYHQEGSAYYIDDADVYTNQKYLYVSTGEADGCNREFYIEGIMVHEVGHVIGIGHSNVNGSTMYPSVSYCDNGPASLANDDTAAHNDLY
jgi:hypothetical protein